MWVTIATTVVVGICAYTFGIAVGFKLRKILVEGEEQARRDSELQVEQQNNSVQGYTYIVDPQASNMTYEHLNTSPDMENSLKVQYMQKIQAAVISQQLHITKDPGAIFSSPAKFDSYVNNPFVTVRQLEDLLEMLDRAELFEWSKVVLEKIKQLQNE